MSGTPIPASLFYQMSKNPLASFLNVGGMDTATEDIIPLTLHPPELELDGGPWAVRAKTVAKWHVFKHIFKCLAFLSSPVTCPLAF